MSIKFYDGTSREAGRCENKFQTGVRALSCSHKLLRIERPRVFNDVTTRCTVRIREIPFPSAQSAKVTASVYVASGFPTNNYAMEERRINSCVSPARGGGSVCKFYRRGREMIGLMHSTRRLERLTPLDVYFDHFLEIYDFFYGNRINLIKGWNYGEY